MNKYQNGKIYIITGSETDKVYLGSTIRTLHQRLVQHKYQKSCSSIEILKNKEYNICLLETYPCNSEKELLWKERYWFDQLKSILVNNDRPIITEEERVEKKKECVKEWRKNNKEYKKEYYKNNKEYAKECAKEYYKDNKEKIIKVSVNICKSIRKYQKTWGGDLRASNNNLLKISLDIFV